MQVSVQNTNTQVQVQVQVAYYQTYLVTDQFVTGYDQIEIINKTTHEITYLVMSV